MTRQFKRAASTATYRIDHASAAYKTKCKLDHFPLFGEVGKAVGEGGGPKSKHCIPFEVECGRDGGSKGMDGSLGLQNPLAIRARSTTMTNRMAILYGRIGGGGVGDDGGNGTMAKQSGTRGTRCYTRHKPTRDVGRCT